MAENASCTEEEVEALLYFISNLYLTLYPIRTLSTPFSNYTAVHGVGVAQAKPACKHTIATRKCYQYNTNEKDIDRYVLIVSSMTALYQSGGCARIRTSTFLCRMNEY